MKKFLASIMFFALALTLSGVVVAAEGPEVTNVQRGGGNVATSGNEVIDAIGQETAKGKNPQEHVVGVVAGTAVGVRRGIHRLGAGAIDLLTFWIPKKEPLIAETRLK